VLCVDLTSETKRQEAVVVVRRYRVRYVRRDRSRRLSTEKHPLMLRWGRGPVGYRTGDSRCPKARWRRVSTCTNQSRKERNSILSLLSACCATVLDPRAALLPPPPPPPQVTKTIRVVVIAQRPHHLLCRPESCPHWRSAPRCASTHRPRSRGKHVRKGRSAWGATSTPTGRRRAFAGAGSGVRRYR